MKITHNKVGQNINLVDGVKQDKTDSSKKVDSSSSLKSDSILESGASRVELSPRALEAKRIKELAMAAPDVDAERVERFKNLIDSGKYKVDAQAVADRMVDEHLENEE